jgi:beta-glucosidase
MSVRGDINYDNVQRERTMRTEVSGASSMMDDVVDRWLNEMNLAEQIGQMSQIDINMLLEDDDHGGKRLNHDAVEQFIGEMGVGSVLNAVAGIPWTARQYREASIALNQIATKYHRPPVIWGLDSVHGANYIQNAILTPQPINIAATWNTTMSFVAGQLASRDTRAAGIHWLFSPLLGLAVEPCWSRVYETFGEDPTLTGDMATAMIQGIQTPERSAVPSRAAACAKHFIGYSMPRTGHDRSPSWIPTRHLYQYFVPPWKQAIHVGRAKTVMESYTETDGVPMVANSDKLNYLLRYRLNFTGVLVTDYAEILNLHNWHHTAASDQDAVIHALQEGSVDVSMIPWDADGFAKSIVAGIQTQQVSQDRIRQSAARVLQLKSDLYMFNETITIVEPNLDRVGTDEALILPMVQDSIILAQNKNDILPLDPNLPLKVHITGPTANSLSMQSGGWTWQWQGSPSDDWFTYGSTVVDAFKSMKTWSVTYSCGVNVLGKECEDPDEINMDENVIDQVKHWVGLTPTTSMAQSVQSAKAADVTIVCIGEEPYAEKPGDIRSLRLPEGQYDLIHAIQRNADTKIVVIYFGGRPRLLGDIVDIVDAVILGFLPGPSAGSALFDIVTGRVNPTGRLPITYPAAEDEGGIAYWHAVTDQCTNAIEGATMPYYEYIPCPVQWSFGHGLSYTTFQYSDFSAIGGIDDDLQIAVTVTNTGSRLGSDTIMFFTFDEFRETTPEYKRLRAYEKVTLAPGKSTVVKARVPMDILRFIGDHDDTHYIFDSHIQTYLGVGYATDCRRRDGDHNPDENPFCVRLQSRFPDKHYIAACDEACHIWQDSRCDSGRDLNICLELCASASANSSVDDGWGWNYVNCLEKVVWDIQQLQQQSEVEDQSKVEDLCWRMTTICRDVFPLANEAKERAIPNASNVPQGNVDSSLRGIPAYYIAFASCLVSSIMIFLVVRGSISSIKRQRTNTEEENFRGIQFTTLPRLGME